MREGMLDRREFGSGDTPAAKRVRQCATRSSPRGNSGKLQSPPQIPTAGRFSRRIVPARSITSTRTARWGNAFRGRGEGNVAIRSSMRATQSPATGQPPQRGARRVQIVAPRSISACVYDSMSRSRQQRVGDAPQFVLRLRRAWIACDATMAREHALHVAVEDRGAGPERERGDRRRRRAPDPGQRGERFDIAGKRAAMLGDNRLRRRMQVMRATVVAQSAPVLEHAIFRSCGQRAHIGECGEKPLVIRDDGRDLRLLQHDLREPDPVRVARVLPRQVVASVRASARRQGAGRKGAGKRWAVDLSAQRDAASP